MFRRAKVPYTFDEIRKDALVRENMARLSGEETIRDDERAAVMTAWLKAQNEVYAVSSLSMATIGVLVAVAAISATLGVEYALIMILYVLIATFFITRVNARNRRRFRGRAVAVAVLEHRAATEKHKRANSKRQPSILCRIFCK